MAGAPLKEGLNYFSHDVHLSNDSKIEFLEAECGLVGYAVYLKLLELIYEKGYFSKFDNRDISFFSKRNNILKEECTQIIQVCIREGLFDLFLYDKYQILTSTGIQKRYLRGCDRRNKIFLIKEYLLLENVEIDCNTKVPIVIKKLINDNINSINDNINSINECNNGINTAKIKESKVNQIKRNEENDLQDQDSLKDKKEEKEIRINLLDPEKDLFDKIIQITCETGLAFIEERRNMIRMARTDKDIGIDGCLAAVKNIVEADVLPNMRKFDYLFNKFEYRVRLTQWMLNAKSPPKRKDRYMDVDDYDKMLAERTKKEKALKLKTKAEYERQDIGDTAGQTSRTANVGSDDDGRGSGGTPIREP